MHGPRAAKSSLLLLTPTRPLTCPLRQQPHNGSTPEVAALLPHLTDVQTRSARLSAKDAGR